MKDAAGKHAQATIIFYLPEEGLKHDPGPWHPESPERLRAIGQALPSGAERAQAGEPADDGALARVHSAAHLERVARLRDAPGDVALDPDTVGNADSYIAARVAAGTAMEAVDRVRGARSALAFCALRPPGHHAEPDRAMGFCFYNNVAVAAAHALASGLERVVVLDFDVHYGNGTSCAFADDPRVLVCQSYQHPFYPFWQGLDRRHIKDCPLPAGSDGARMREVVEEQWGPAIATHAPQLILVSAGFDAHIADPLAELRWSGEDYRWLGAWIRQQAEAFCEGCCVAVLEGGYETAALAASVRDFCAGYAYGSAAIADASSASNRQ